MQSMSAHSDWSVASPVPASYSANAFFVTCYQGSYALHRSLLNLVFLVLPCFRNHKYMFLKGFYLFKGRDSGLKGERFRVKGGEIPG